MFGGFPEEAFAFFLAIRFNNNREYFSTVREDYRQNVRMPALSLCAELSKAIEEIDPELERRPERCVARINRDVRFSRDKSPYRDHLWLSFRRPGLERGLSLSFWFEVGANGGSWGLGTYSENTTLTKAIRSDLCRDDRTLPSLWRGLESSGLSLWLDKRKRIVIPEGMAEDAKQWYAMRSFYIEREVRDLMRFKQPSLAEEIREDFFRLRPIYEYMNERLRSGEES